MPKLVYPLLVVVGVLVGLWVAVRKKKLVVNRRWRHPMRVVVVTAALVAGFFSGRPGLAEEASVGRSGDDAPVQSPKVKCYDTVATPGVEESAATPEAGAASQGSTATTAEGQGSEATAADPKPMCYVAPKKQPPVPPPVKCYAPIKPPPPQPSCYDMPAPVEVSAPDQAKQALDTQMTLLEKLHVEGKLTDAAYAATLESAKQYLQTLEAAGAAYQSALDDATGRFVTLRKLMDDQLIAKILTTSEWKTLQKALDDLRTYDGNDQRATDTAKVKAALDTLAVQGVILDATKDALVTVFSQVALQLEGTIGPVSCYMIGPTAHPGYAPRALLLKMIKSFDGSPLDASTRSKLLADFAYAVTCLTDSDLDACKKTTEAEPFDLVAVSQAFDLLVGLSN